MGANMASARSQEIPPPSPRVGVGELMKEQYPLMPTVEREGERRKRPKAHLHASLSSSFLHVWVTLSSSLISRLGVKHTHNTTQ